jgi:hypothetical protein
VNALRTWARTVGLGVFCAAVSAVLAPSFGNDPATMGYRGFIAGVVITGSISPVQDAIQERRKRKRDA